MFEIGDSLREARTLRGLSPEDVQKGIRIRARYLTALEEERWELLPAEAYAKGFLRTYAEFLGLDGQLYVDEFNARVAREESEPLVPETLAPRGGSRLLFRTIGGVLVLGAIAGAAVAFGGPVAPSPSVAPPSLVAVADAATPRAAAAVKPIAHLRRAARPHRAVAVIRAVRGTSWLSVRRGGPDGREIFRGYLLRGHALTYDRAVWVRMGRPSALDVRAGATRVSGLPRTPVNLLLSRDGARAG